MTVIMHSSDFNSDFTVLMLSNYIKRGHIMHFLVTVTVFSCFHSCFSQANTLHL